MADKKVLVYDTTFNVPDEATSADRMVFPGGAKVEGAPLEMSSQKVTGMADGTVGTDGVNKSQLDNAIISGGTIKEALLTTDQLDDTDGINAAEMFFFDSIPTAGDIVILKNATTTLTMTAVANQGAEAAETDFSIETDAATAMARLVLRANAAVANDQWDLAVHDDHEDVNALVIVAIEKASAAGLSASRIYGTWTTQADFQVVEFQDATGVTKYEEESATTASTTDPTAPVGRFGLRREKAALTDGEIHFILDVDQQWAWDGDGQTWQQLSGAGSIPDATAASGGGIKGKVTFDSDLGMAVAAGVASLNITADKGLHFSGGALEIEIANANELSADANGLAVEGVPSAFKIGGTTVSANVSAVNLNTLTAGVASDADALHTHDGLSATGHTHTHASTTGQGTDDHHAQSHTVASHSDTTATGAELNTLTGGSASNADSLHTHVAIEVDGAKKIENSHTTSAAVAVGDPVYPSGNDTVAPADAADVATNKAHVIGVARTADAVGGATVEVVGHGKSAAGVISGATAGNDYFLDQPNGLRADGPSGSGRRRLIRCGFALNATDLYVLVNDLGIRTIP